MERYLRNINEYMLYLTAKAGYENSHSKNTIKKWLQMFNFNIYPTGNNISTAIGMLVGYIYNLFFLFDLKFFTVEYFVKGVIGLIFAVAVASLVRIINIVIDMKIRPIIQNFRIKKKRK